jgi:hypothetical protein
MSRSSAEKANIHTITPPTDLSEAERFAVFEHFFRRLAAHRNQFEIYALAEAGYIQEEGGTGSQKAVLKELDLWGQQLLKSAWAACQEPGGGSLSRHMMHSLQF